MKQIKIKFTINTKEDFHIGTGMDNIGLYDDGQIKDEEGFPTIKTETFKGLLRQSCREIKYKNKIDRDVYEQIFSFKNMNSLDIELTVKKFDDTVDPFIIHTFTAIDHDSHKAKDKSLRDIEFAAKGIEFEGELTFLVMDDSNGMAEKVKDFLMNGLNNLKWIGGYRRRGFGLIEISISEKKITELNSKNVTNTKGQVLNLVLQLQDDTTISGAGIQGNNMQTLDYIPGTTILGMTRVLLMRMENKKADYLNDDKIKANNFYPLPKSVDVSNINQSNYPFVFPIPLSVRRHKKTNIFKNIGDEYKGIPHWVLKQTTKKTVANMVSQNTIDESKTKDKEGFSDKSFSGGYICSVNGKKFDAETDEYFTVDTALTMRNTIDKEKQITGDDSLFTQEQIKKGTSFIGKIIFDSDEDASIFENDFADWLNGKIPFHIGRGGKPAIVRKYWIPETEEIKIDFENKNPFTITLFSDAILLEDDLQPAKTLTPKILKNYLDLSEGSIKLKNWVSSNSIIQSYTGTAGLRRFSDRAITKGSVFYFEYSGDKWEDLESALIKLEKDGIGFRRNEGFGQIMINHPIHNFTQEKNYSPKTGYEYQKSKLHDTYRNRLGEKATLYDMAETCLNGLKAKNPSNSFYGRMISKLEAKIPVKEMNEFLKHNSERRESDCYTIFQKAWDSLNDKTDRYEILKIALLKQKHNVGGTDE